MLSYKLPPGLNQEIEGLESLIKAHLAGNLDASELKARRVPFGVYEQRSRGTYMVRVRCAAGIITPLQLRAVATIATEHASGVLHITTRQEVQIHGVAIEDLSTVLRKLANAGLSSRGGGGNTVRNIIAPCDAGISKEEAFDVTPHTVELTSRMVSLANSWLLPRKYKIAFSGSFKDDAHATLCDLGFIACVKNGKQGFKVFVAGGMGRMSQPGQVLHDFVRESEVFIIAEAIKRLFSKLGNRRNKHAARLRFLWNTLGQEKFFDLYEEEKARIIAEFPAPFAINPIPNTSAEIGLPHPQSIDSADFALWMRRYVFPQTQEGLCAAKIPLFLGDLSSDKAMLLADVLANFGENTIRFTCDQNVSVRNIPHRFLGNIFVAVQKITDLWCETPFIGNAIACAGAGTCQLGICLSRGALMATVEKLKTASAHFDLLRDFRLHFSGCSNSCSHHMGANLGFVGKVGRKDQRAYPMYAIYAGAVIDAVNGSRLAERIDDINAHDLPKFAQEFLNTYLDRKDAFATFDSYLEREGKTQIQTICNKYREVPTFEVEKSYYFDWGAGEPFSLAGRGTGECSAGLFDLIEMDLARLREIRTAIPGTENHQTFPGRCYDLVLMSARMLLITRGVEPTSEFDVFDQFAKLFIHEKLVDSRFLPVVNLGRDKNKEALVLVSKDIVALAGAVEKLYQGMDNTLQFKPAGNEADQHGEPGVGKKNIREVLDMSTARAATNQSN
jgi:sulfite reductase (ferredoxin)